jgi:type I restriction enzyme, S subunit
MINKTNFFSPIGNSSICEINPNDSYLKNDEYPFIPMDAVRNGYSGIEYFEKRVIDGSGLVSFKENDTIVAKITPCAENGKVAFINSLPNKAEIGFGSTEFIVFRPNQKNVFPKFLYAVLSSHQVHGLAVSLMEGSTGRQRIPQKAYKKRIYAHFPPLPEQKAIAGVLSKVDEAIEAVENSVKAAGRLKKSLMQNLLTGKLKPDGMWRSEDEFYVNEKFGKVPKGWRWGRLSEIADIIAGQSPSGEFYNDVGNGIPMLNGPTEFTVSHPVPVQWTSKVTKLCSVGDILFTVRGSSTGRMNIADQTYCIGRGIAAIRNKEDSDIDFIYHTLITISEKILAEAKGAGTTFPNVSRGELLKKWILIPKTGQADIASKIKGMDYVEKQKQSKINSLKILKKSLMQNLLTGKVRVDVEKINKLLEMAE